MDQSIELSPFLKSCEFVAFDTETTGIWAPANRIVEIAGVKFQLGSEKTNQFQELVNPEREMPPEVIKIHGINDEMVSEADKIGPVLDRFFSFCGENVILVAHNAPFDISFVIAELERHNVKPPALMVIDTVDIARKLFPGMASYSLLALSKELGIAQSQEHRALSDAVLVECLLRKAFEKPADLKSTQDFKKISSIYNLSSWSNQSDEIPDKFSILVEAAKSNLSVEMQYERPGYEPNNRTVRPLRFYSLSSRHYMTAFCELVNEERTFRLDRILEFNLKSESD